MDIYSIYKATNIINGKCYIGFDSKWPRRQKAHKKYDNIKHKQYNSLFHRAIRKYGWNNFEWEIIYQSQDGKHCLNEMEGYFIQFYDSYRNGYNMTLGGDGILGYHHTNKTKKYIGECSKGNKNTKGRKLSEKEMQIRYTQWLGKKNPNYGKTGKNHHCTKKYLLVSPNNEKFFVTNGFIGVENFGITLNAAGNSLRKNMPISKGKYKNWQCFYA